MVKNLGLCTVILFTGNQAPQKAVFQVPDIRGYLILGCGTAQKIGLIKLPGITPQKFTQLPKAHAHHELDLELRLQ